MCAIGFGSLYYTFVKFSLETSTSTSTSCWHKLLAFFTYDYLLCISRFEPQTWADKYSIIINKIYFEFPWIDSKCAIFCTQFHCERKIVFFFDNWKFFEFYEKVIFDAKKFQRFDSVHIHFFWINFPLIVQHQAVHLRNINILKLNAD